MHFDDDGAGDIGSELVDEYEALFDRAHQFNGYDYVGGDANDADRLAMSVRAQWVESGFSGIAPDDLRAALFVECRRLRFGGNYPTRRLYSYLRQLDDWVSSAERSNGNPWRRLMGTESPWVLPEDRPHIEAFNAFASDATRIDLSLPPEPWIGRLDAPVIVLNLNPGIGPGDQARWTDELRNAVWQSFGGERMDWPLYSLDPRFESSGGSDWWRGALKSWISELGAQAVSRHVICIEFHGYHSKSFQAMPVTLPSQRWMFRHLRDRLADEAAVIIGLRGRRTWITAVPELLDHPRVHWSSNPRRSSISQASIGSSAWDLGVHLIERADAR